MNASALRAVRARFGDLAEPILALRRAGRRVAPFGAGFLIDNMAVSAETLCEEADRLKARQARLSEAKEPRQTADRKAAGGRAGTTDEANGPGSAPAPIEEPRSPATWSSDSTPTAEPVVPARKDGRAGERGTRRTCAKCGRPRSRESKALCAICYAQAGRGSYPAKPTADVRDKFAKSKSCGGRGVEALRRDNPAPHGFAPSVGAGHDQQTCTVAGRRDRRAPDVGNVEEPETGPERPPRPSPPQDAIAAVLCGCGKPKSPPHRRCWSIRGLPGPIKSRTTKPYTAGPEQGAAVLKPPLDDAPQAARIEEPTTTPALAVGADAGTSCGCGRPKGHHGRCWFKRGQQAPPGKRVYPKGRNHTSRIAALEARLDAFEATVRDAVRELLARIDHLTGEGR